MWKTKVISSRTARASAKPVAGVVGSSPSASTPSSENSRASIAAIAELAEGLDFVFDQANYEEEPGDLLQLHLDRLNSEAAKYRNSQVEHAAEDEWTCTHETAELMYAACQCSSMVYDPVAQPGPELIPVMSRTPSMTGTTKAMSIWKFPKSQALIVSVRGSSSAADHMVNMNATPKDASSTFKSHNGETTVYAHGGFLSCAKALLPSLSQEISRQLRADSSISQIVFTGHSAGGAVSSLVFLHFASTKPSYLSSIKLSLATFGSAPVTSPSVTELAKGLRGVQHVLSFVNEYDMVTRADRPYLRSIVDLYRSKYGLPSVGLEKKHQWPIPELDPNVKSVIDGRPDWSLPSPFYSLVGDIVVLQSCLNSSSVTHDAASDASTIVSPSLRAIRISETAFGKLLFCEVGVHKRRVYLDRMNKVTTQILTGPGSNGPPSFVSDESTVYTEEAVQLTYDGNGIAVWF